MTLPIVVVGDCLLDRDLDGSVERVCPDAPVPIVEQPRAHARPGGAGLAACMLARDGHRVALVTALALDPAGEELRALLEEAGVEIWDLGLSGPTPVKLRIRAAGRTLLRLDQGGVRDASPTGQLARGALHRLESAAAVLVSDYGWGITSIPDVRRALEARCHEAPLVWDPHPHGSEPVAHARLVKS